jgi:hypothetical protein
MLLDNPTLQGIVDGTIRVVFRTWKKPTVKAGGKLRTRMGLLSIEAVDVISLAEVSARDIKLAGLNDRAEFERSVTGRDGTLYRIRVKHAGEDPRIALRKQTLGPGDVPLIHKRLERMDTASDDGPWTRRYLELIAERPAQRAPELATMMGLETKPFKTRVRRLKELGLTESLPVGYRLSPRGQSYLAALGPGRANDPKSEPRGSAARTKQVQTQPARGAVRAKKAQTQLARSAEPRSARKATKSRRA